MKRYVESLYGIFTGKLFLCYEIAAKELTDTQREELYLSAKEHGIEIVFVEYTEGAEDSEVF